jgi:thiamine-phosphate pyrophosphorylase
MLHNMNKNISTLHYITQDVDGLSHTDLIKQVCAAGIGWIQLRLKNRTHDQKIEIAVEARKICDHYNAKLIINDDVAIAGMVNADGVHLGKTDMDPREARKILGENTIIGGTANTFEDIQYLAEAGVDYIGSGPFRFTSTKENLSPIIGLEGYESIMRKCRENNMMIPVIAIGGIRAEDVGSLKEIGLYGIAVSSAINLAPAISDAVRDFKNELN